MKIDSKRFTNFIEKVCVNGAIKNCVMRFEADGLHITVTGGKEACMCMGVLNSTAFSEYTPMEVTEKNVPLLLALLRDMVGTVDMSVVNKKFCFSAGNQSAELFMPDLKYVTSNLDDSAIPVLNNDDGFDLDVGTLLVLTKKKFDQFKVPFIEIKTESGNLFLIVGEEGFDKITITEKVDYKDASGTFGNILMEIVGVLEGTVNVTFDNNYPMIITERGEDYYVKWLVAPMVSV